MKTTYKLFVNGAYQSMSENYDWMFQRGLALAMYLGISDSFTNTRTDLIIDKWSNGEQMILITKEFN